MTCDAYIRGIVLVDFSDKVTVHSMAAVVSDYFLSSNSNLSQSNSSELAVLDVLSLTSGVICALIVLTLLLVVVCVYKAYKTTLQRLVLYHIVFSLVCELSNISFALLHFYEQLNLSTCKVILYLSIYFALLWGVYTTVVTNCLFLFTLCLIKGRSRFLRHGKVAEFLCICLTIIAPMTYIWIPIRDKYYAVDNCENFSPTTLPSEAYEMGLILYTMIVAMHMEIFLVCVAMCTLFCFLRRRLRNSQLTNLLKNLLYYTVCNMVLVIFTILLTITCYYLYHNYPLPSLSAAVTYVSGVGTPLVVLVFTVMLLPLAVRSESCKCTCNNFCFKICRRRQQVNLNVNESQNEQTNPSSHPMNQPSHTYFSIPYTGEFTQVSVNNRSEDNGERTPLIK